MLGRLSFIVVNTGLITAILAIITLALVSTSLFTPQCAQG